jgi:hypothetical protein
MLIPECPMKRWRLKNRGQKVVQWFHLRKRSGGGLFPVNGMFELLDGGQV